jgi:hypothetical protein
MNRFIPVGSFLRKRRARRSFDNVEDLVNCCSSNDWSQDRFARGLLKRCSSVWRTVPLGNQDADREFEFWGLPPDSRNMAALPRVRCELTRLPERRRVETGEHTGGSAPHGSRPAATLSRTSTTVTGDGDYYRPRVPVTASDQWFNEVSRPD